VSGDKGKPILDEQTLATLLEAAFVLQEHNRRMQEMELRVEPEEQAGEKEPSAPVPANATLDTPATEAVPQDDYTHTLAQIVETQHKIQLRHLELKDAMSLVAGRVMEITKAGGAAISILDGKKLRYGAAAGVMTLPVGTEVLAEKAVCASCLRTGQVIRCPDVGPEFLIDNGECLRRGIHSLIAVPVFHEGGVAGSLELYYARTQGFTEHDVHTCQLMAGLVTESLARDEELTWKKSLASERAVMMEALEKLKPNLAALADVPATKDAAATPTPAAAKPALSERVFVCLKCGSKLVGKEHFCGKCGAPRGVSDYEPLNRESKVASLWHMQESAKKGAADGANGDLAAPEPFSVSDRLRPEKPLADSIEEEMPDLFAVTALPADEMIESEDDSVRPALATPSKIGQTDDGPSAKTALAKLERAADWSSAVTARDFLEQLAAAKPGSFSRFWKARRGDVYLAIAVILVAAVIRWGIWSSHSVSATGTQTTSAAGHRKPAPDADLSVFDRMLISVGLADPPPAPEYRGNPDTQVWVDLHTALYYCPGADLYGKTPKGKFTTQRDAQLDQYEPAYRKTCD